MIEQPQEDFSGSFDEHVDAPKSNGKSYKQRRFKLTFSGISLRMTRFLSN